MRVRLCFLEREGGREGGGFVCVFELYGTIIEERSSFLGSCLTE